MTRPVLRSSTRLPIVGAFALIVMSFAAGGCSGVQSALAPSGTRIASRRSSGG